MFFLTNLVFAIDATQSITNARVIGRKKEPDINVNIINSEYVFTNAVLDPTTKGNIETYIVKDNVDTVFSLLHGAEDRGKAVLHNYYYTSFKNKNLTIRCFDTVYYGGVALNVVPKSTYDVLKITNRLHDCLFIFEFDYEIQNEDGEIENRNKKYAFKIVGDAEYEMYKNMSIPIYDEYTENGEIKRPRKRD